MGTQVNDRAPAAGRGHEIAGEPPRRARDQGARGVQRGDGHSLDALFAAHFEHPVSADHLDAARAGGLGQRPVRLASGIHHGDHLAAGLAPVDGRAIRRIVVGKQHQPLPGGHAVAVQIGPDRAGQHHARHIVIAEHQGPLDGARGQNHLFGAHPVQALARAVVRGEALMIAAPLDNTEEIMIVIAEYRAARE